MRRLALIVAATVLVLGAPAAAPAGADDLPPPVFPSGLPGPGDVGNDGAQDVSPSQGPTYVLTPGSTGTALPPPVTGAADLPTGTATPNAPGTPGERAKNMVNAPVGAATDAEPTPGRWVLGAGLLVLVVLTGAGLTLRAGHRRVTRDAASR